LIQEARKKRHLTQEELALKVGTTKSYISRIENAEKYKKEYFYEKSKK